MLATTHETAECDNSIENGKSTQQLIDTSVDWALAADVFASLEFAQANLVCSESFLIADAALLRKYLQQEPMDIIKIRSLAHRLKGSLAQCACSRGAQKMMMYSSYCQDFCGDVHSYEDLRVRGYDVLLEYGYILKHIHNLNVRPP